MTVAGVSGDGVSADPTVPAGAREAVVDVSLAPGASKADGASTFEAVDQVVADPPVETGIHLTLVYVHLALGPRES